MLRLISLEKKHMPLLIDMMDEWTAREVRLTPWVIWKNGQMDYRDFEGYSANLAVRTTDDRWMASSVFFALDEERELFVGAVEVRHGLNDYLLRHGGHIGDGVRPSERGKGYGTEIVRLALEKCREMGIMDVLMVCDKNNIASAKTIIRNGGVMENEVADENGTIDQRYWIHLA